VTPTEKGKRADALNQGPDTRRVLCEMVANREGDIDDLRNLVRDALACVRESSRGYMTHPKTYRDLHSRAKKLGVVE
jgi:hypothetical protein